MIDWIDELEIFNEDLEPMPPRNFENLVTLPPFAILPNSIINLSQIRMIERDDTTAVVHWMGGEMGIYQGPDYEALIEAINRCHAMDFSEAGKEWPETGL